MILSTSKSYNLLYLANRNIKLRQYSKEVSKQKSSSSKWKSVVGLEVHAQIATNSKLFSGSGTDFEAPLNSNVSLFDASIPGTLPVLNKSCVIAGIKTATALQCKVNPVSFFDRKHYFYADLPAGYQITQQRAALANHGQLKFPVVVPGSSQKPYEKVARLLQLQLEQDSGKSLHDDEAKRSLVDLNRAGIPLMEFVFEPDLETGDEAASLIKELILILKRLSTCSCRMEEGALRVDANVSIHKEGEPFGTRTEVKNIGSVRSVAQAVNFEIDRQIKIKEAGGSIHNETRSWDANTRQTVAMRDKEVQLDYRFMPEPNLLPLHLDVGDLAADDKDGRIRVADIRDSLPELPNRTREKIIEEFNFTTNIAVILVNEPVLHNFFKTIVENVESISPKVVANFLINDLLTICNKNNDNLESCPITSTHLVNILSLLQKEVINLQIARIVLNALYEQPTKTAEQIVREKNLAQIIDPVEIDKLCRETISKLPKVVKQYKAGKTKVLYAIVGEVASMSENRANMEKVVAHLKDILKE